MKELEDVSDPLIKSSARTLDLLAKGIDPRTGEQDPRCFRTLIHGDAKAANCLFDKSGHECAFYDFQYTGHAYTGMRDVVKLCVSSVRKGMLTGTADEERIVGWYWRYLLEGFAQRGPDVGQGFTFELCMRQYEICLADYTRFLAGMCCVCI